MWYVYSQPKGVTPGLAHLSTDGLVEDCATRPPGTRERGGEVGDLKAEDLLAARLMHKTYRRCRKCFRYGARFR